MQRDSGLCYPDKKEEFAFPVYKKEVDSSFCFVEQSNKPSLKSM